MNVIHKGNVRAVVLGDCLEAMREMPDARFTACVTDPPYHLTQASRRGSPRKNDPSKPHGRHSIGETGFMGKVWDGGGVAFEPRLWCEVLRVCKPGAFLLAFGGTRTHHRLACAIEDAGWEVRDCLMWVYGSGFPKNMNVAKAVSKAERGCPQGGADPESPGHGKYKGGCSKENPGGRGFGAGPGQYMKEQVRDPEASPTLSAAARKWWGWGTSLKPAWEPIIVAMKPLDGTFAANALKHGVAGLNIDAGRIGWASGKDREGLKRLEGYKGKAGQGSVALSGGVDGSLNVVVDEQLVGHDKGRWPANFLLQHDERCVQVGSSGTPGEARDEMTPSGHDAPAKFGYSEDRHQFDYKGEDVEVWACVPGCPVRMLDAQNPSTSKTGNRRNKHRVQQDAGTTPFTRGRDAPEYVDSGGASRFFYCAKSSTRERNAGMPEGEKCKHPTVKPLRLMEYLLKLVTMPEGTLVLDPFVGSGTTLCAAARLGLRAVGIDSDPESCQTAVHRLKHWEAEAAKGE